MTTEEITELIKLMNASKPQVHQTLNFNGPVGQQIAHVDRIDAHFDKDMKMQITNAEEINIDDNDNPSLKYGKDDGTGNDVDLFNLIIFLPRIFDSTERLKRLRDVIACAIDIGNGEEGKNEYTLNLAQKSEWYYLMEALIEAKVVRGTLTVPDLYRQMKEWFPEIAALKGDVKEEKFISNLTGSVSAERRKWKEMATENVIPLKEMVVKNQASSRMKQERALDLYNAAYTGLCVKLQALKADIEKEKAKH